MCVYLSHSVHRSLVGHAEYSANISANRNVFNKNSRSSMNTPRLPLSCKANECAELNREPNTLLHVHSADSSTFLREVTSCPPSWKWDVKSKIQLRQLMRLFTWRIFLTNFIQIRCETTEHWAFLKNSLPIKKPNKNMIEVHSTRPPTGWHISCIGWTFYRQSLPITAGHSKDDDKLYKGCSKVCLVYM